LKNIMLRLYESELSGNVYTLDSLFSRREDILAIGTDPDEWRGGYTTIDRGHKAQFQEMGKFQIKAVNELTAFVEGTVGWAADKAEIQLPNGLEIPVRVTTIFHEEGVEWEIVQHQISVGVPNEYAIGKELTIK
jgi:hypothetical protein